MKTSLVNTNKLHTHFITTKTKFLTLLVVFLASFGWGQSSANYNFTFGASTLNNMTGSTSLMSGNQDDAGSLVFPIGFNFIYMGTSYSHISVNSNGQARLHTSSGATAIGGADISSYSASTVTLALMAGDNEVGSGMSYIVTGSAPNRKLIIEWNNFYANWTDLQTSGNMQLVLNETTGVFEYLYGNILNSSTSSVQKSIFHSSGSTANASAFVTVGATPTVNTSATSPTTNTFAASVAIANLANRMFTFTPPIPVSGPTNLTFTNVTASSMTLNWTAATPTTGIVRYVVQRSADGGITYPVSTNVALGTNTLVVTGLTPSTNYTYKVVAVSEGVESAPASSSQSTNAPTTYTWIATSGASSWITPTSWSPDRTTPDATDILNFSNGGSSIVTNIPTQTISNIVFSNTTEANFQAASTATLTLGGLTIPSGSILMSNGTTAALTIAFSSGAVNTIGGRLEISNTGTPANGITFANSVTTVSSTGTLAAGGSVAATITGTTSTLLINGSYEHKYTTVSGTIPTATWADGSNCSIIGYTTNTSSVGLGQSFWNFSWNCPSQTSSYTASVSGSFVVRNNLNLVSTGTGTFTNSGTNTYSIKNIVMSGGSFNLASSTATYTISGDFTKTAGTMTPTGNCVFNFSNTTTAQNLTLDALAVNPATWRFSNPFGVTITGTGSFPTAFPIGNGTSGGVRISTIATNPITFAGTITNGFSYNTANTTLTYDATSGNTISRDIEFPASNGPANLTVAVGSANVLTVPFSRTIPGTLTMTSGDINISSNNLTLGTSTSALGTLSYTAGAIRVTSGTLTRWFGTSGLPTSAPTSGIGFYPLSAGLNNRNVGVFFSTATALSSGGTITIGHTDVAGLSTLTSFTDGVYNVDTRTNASWTVSTGNGMAASGTLGIRLTGAGAFSTSTVANLRVIQASAADGTHAAGTGSTPNFQASRSGLSLAQIANTHYIGAASADIQSVFVSVVSGDWNNSAIWDLGTVPTCTGNVTIMNGHNVTVNSASNVSRNLTVNTGGTLTVASGDLTVGCTLNNTPLTNNGTLTVSGGTLNVNGNVNLVAGSTFNMSGASQMKIDGNGNSSSTSVSAGTRIFQVSSNLGTVNGGTITIVDPHFDNATTQTFGYSVSSLNWAWNGNTLILGDGSSTDASSSTRGFELDCYTSSGLLVLGNIIVNGGSATNRFTTTANATNNGTFLTNLSINSASEFRNTTATNFFVQGDITNNGTLTIPNSIILSTPSGVAVASTQTISGSGVFRNATSSPTASLGTLLVNNSNSTGVLISVPLSISGTLNMTSGKINTTATNLLTLGTATAAGTLSYTAGQIAGPFARTFAASRTATGTYSASTLFPVGDGTNYTPIHIDPTTTASGATVMRGQVFNSNSGSAGIGMASPLSNDRWEALVTSGSSNLTSCFVGLNDAQIATGNVIAQSASAAGTYDLISPTSTFVSGTPNALRTPTAISAASYTGYFTYAAPGAFTWTGTTSTDWNTASNWSPQFVPTTSFDVIIPSSGIINFPVATSLTIASGKTTTLNSNAQLTINGTLTNNGTLTLESGATLVQGTGNTVAGSGTFNVKQALTGAGGATPSGRFWYLGSPVSTANSGVFNAAGNNRLWTYSETALAYNTEITDNTTALSPMQGAVVRLGASETSIFTGGLLNTGDYTSSLTRTGTTDSKRGYTLLSNPYPSYLDWSAAYNAAVASNANISSSIWYRTHNSTSNTMVFDIYNASSGIVANNSGGTLTQYIPPMQAFWVYNPTDGTTGSLTFSNSMRSHQPTGGGLKSSTDFPAFVRLNLENDGAIDQTVLYFDNNAAAGYDNFDSDKMMLANAAQVYSFVDSKKLAINGMKSVKANKQVPLTVEFPTAKAYSFNATEVAMIDGIVLLEDRLTKVFQDLTMNPVYEFEAAAGTDADRFVVHFQATGGVAGIETAEDNGIAIVSNAAGLVTITLSEELPAVGTIQIIDINGKVIATQAINEQATTMNINAATGVYHVLVDSSTKVARKKIVITK